MARRGENIYKHKDGRYEGRYMKGYDANGKAVYGRSYTETRDKLNKHKAEYKLRPIDANKTDITVSEWFIKWIETKADIKDSTRQVYRRHIKIILFPIWARRG